jgi:hypothetical protein
VSRRDPRDAIAFHLDGPRNEGQAIPRAALDFFVRWDSSLADAVSTSHPADDRGQVIGCVWSTRSPAGLTNCAPEIRIVARARYGARTGNTPRTSSTVTVPRIGRGRCRCQLIRAEFRISERAASPRRGLDSSLARRSVSMTDSPTTTAAIEP